MPTAIAASTIVAQAFRFMELRPISSFADDSPKAAAASEQYLPALELCLALSDWSFARNLVTLPPKQLGAGQVADPDLPGLFKLPSDCIALRRVYPDNVAYRLDADCLRSEMTDALTIRYTGLVENENLLPSSFATAVSLQLAIRLAPEWVSSRVKRDRLATDFSDAIQAVRLAEGTTASHGRLDGRGEQADWACEAATGAML